MVKILLQRMPFGDIGMVLKVIVRMIIQIVRMIGYGNERESHRQGQSHGRFRRDAELHLVIGSIRMRMTLSSEPAGKERESLWSCEHSKWTL